MYLELGNSQTKSGQRNDDGTVTFQPLDGDRVTTVVFPEGTSIAEAFATVTAGNGVWANHSDGTPTWVECSSAGLQALLAEHYGCDEGKPADVEDTHYTTSGPPGVGPQEDEA